MLSPHTVSHRNSNETRNGIPGERTGREVACDGEKKACGLEGQGGLGKEPGGGGRWRLPAIDLATSRRQDRTAGEATFCKALRPG